MCCLRLHSLHQHEAQFRFSFAWESAHLHATCSELKLCCIISIDWVPTMVLFTLSKHTTSITFKHNSSVILYLEPYNKPLYQVSRCTRICIYLWFHLLTTYYSPKPCENKPRSTRLFNITIKNTGKQLSITRCHMCFITLQ
jgi:hypothetical protein